MTPGFKVAKCCGCGTLYFPRRLVCRVCGSDSWIDETLHDAVIEESTSVMHVAGREDGAPSHLATARTAAGPRLVVGLDAPLPDGTRVRLFDKNGAPVAQAAPVA